MEATADAASLPAGFTISAGLASAPEHAREFALLLERAGLALYESKENGRNRTTVWDSRPRAIDAA